MVVPTAVPSSATSPLAPSAKPMATPIAMGTLKPGAVLTTSPFEAAFGIKSPVSPARTETAASAPSDRQYVAMSPAGDSFIKSSAQEPAYFSAQSLRAQFSGFALQALKEQRIRALQFASPAVNGGASKGPSNNPPPVGKPALGQPATLPDPPTILYQFSAQPGPGSLAAPASRYQVGVRVQAQFGDAASDSGRVSAQYHVEPFMYRPAQASEGLHVGRQPQVPHILKNSVPQSPNAVRTATGQLRMMSELPAGVDDVTPQWMLTARQHLQTVLTFAGRYLPAVHRYLGYDSDTNTLQFGSRSVALQRHQARLSDNSTEAVPVTPLRLVRMAGANGLATLHRPLGVPEAMASQTHARLTDSRTSLERLTDMLGNGLLFGANWLRQPEKTLMSPPVLEKIAPGTANPFKTVVFSGKKETQ